MRRFLDFGLRGPECFKNMLQIDLHFGQKKAFVCSKKRLTPTDSFHDRTNEIFILGSRKRTSYRGC